MYGLEVSHCPSPSRNSRHSSLVGLSWDTDTANMVYEEKMILNGDPDDVCNCLILMVVYFQSILMVLFWQNNHESRIPAKLTLYS